jgi:hypothetical protein
MALEPTAIIRPAVNEVDVSGMTRHYIDQMDKNKKEMKQLKEMLTAIFDGDATYQLHESAYKEALLIKNNTKKQILKQPQAAELTAKIADLRSEMKEGGQQLSLFLDDYYRKTGNDEIEDSSGNVRKIVKTLKVRAK